MLQSKGVPEKNSANSKGTIKPLPSQVFEIIEQFLLHVQYGHLVLIIQDGVVVKIDKIEKFLISTKSRGKGLAAKDKTVKKHPMQMKILTEMQSIQYGQLVIHMDNGHIGQIEKTEKKRIGEFEGLHGDGI